MGLKERREQQDFVEKMYPELEKQITEAAKFDVEIEVNWDTLAIDGSSHLYSKCWPKVYFEPVIEAFKSITTDDMGAEALKGSLKKVIIKNEVGTSTASRWCSFSDGVVTLDHKPTTNVDGSSYEDRIKILTTTLEDNL